MGLLEKKQENYLWIYLEDKYDAYVDGLSRGMKQRLCLARCLVHNPDLLILDEPASGMDPRARYEMKGILRNLKEMGKTIIVSSHILPELGEVCTNIGIVKNGVVVCQGTVDEIMTRAAGASPIVFTVLDKEEDAVKALKELPYVDSIKVDDKKITANIKGDDEVISNLLKFLVLKDIPILNYSRAVGNLEDVFIQITADSDEEV